VSARSIQLMDGAIRRIERRIFDGQAIRSWIMQRGEDGRWNILTMERGEMSCEDCNTETHDVEYCLDFDAKLCYACWESRTDFLAEVLTES